MIKKIKLLLFIFLLFTSLIISNFSFAKYVSDNSYLVAQLNITRTKPIIELLDISSSNVENANIANKTDTIKGHIKLTEKNIHTCNLSMDTIIVLVNGKPVEANFKVFRVSSLTRENRVYEFTFTNVSENGALSIMIPEGTVLNTSYLSNVELTFPTDITFVNS